ncbi:unnamed protein product, partial [Ranitomeya imitator]
MLDFNNLDCDPLKLYISLLLTKTNPVMYWHYSPDSFTLSNYMDNDDSRIRGRLCPSLIGRGNLYDIIVAMATIMTSTSILCPLLIGRGLAASTNQTRGISTSMLCPSLIGRGLAASLNQRDIERRKTPVCGFVTPLDGSEGDDHRKPEAVVLEGNYWKRRIEVVMKEYNKWRIYYKKRLRKLHQDGKLSEGQKVGIVVKKVKNCNIGGLSTALQNAADKPLMPNGAPTWRGGELFAACQRIEDGRGKEDDMLYDLDYFLTDISDTLFTTTQNMPPSYQYPDFVRLYNPFNDLLVPGPI